MSFFNALFIVIFEGSSIVCLGSRGYFPISSVLLTCCLALYMQEALKLQTQIL
jgi:hypothetical protein